MAHARCWRRGRKATTRDIAVCFLSHLVWPMLVILGDVAGRIWVQEKFRLKSEAWLKYRATAPCQSAPGTYWVPGAPVSCHRYLLQLSNRITVLAKCTDFLFNPFEFYYFNIQHYCQLLSNIIKVCSFITNYNYQYISLFN